MRYLPKKLRRKIFERDNFTCVYCGARSYEEPLEIDHVIPRCKGGTDNENNLVTSCRKCNRMKGKRLPNSAMWEKIAQALNVPVNELSGETEIVEKPTTSHSDTDVVQKVQQMLKHFAEDNFRSSVLGWADGFLIYNDGEQVIRLKDTPENKKIFHNIVYEMLESIARSAEAQEQSNIPPVNITQQNIGRDAKAEVRQIAEATA